MEEIRQVISSKQEQLHEAAKLLPCPAGRACFFDIETTGLSPRVSSLYLIGAAYETEDGWHLVQWFADDYTSEETLLRSFAEFSSRFDTFVHYNGSTFDIPYLEKKYQSYHLPSPFAEKDSLDLYRQIRAGKKQFPTKDRKLTTMERLLGFQRHDTFSGKDCIRLYTDFMQMKYFRDPQALQKKECLLLHNQEDLIGTILCTGLLAYDRYKPYQPSYYREGKEICFSDKLPHSVPVPLQYEEEEIRYEYKENTLRIHVPLREDTLYHFFPDYRNYFYLPKEDMAVHKSVGTYVDRAFRERATAANCYIKKAGTFLPLPKGIDWSAPVFSYTRKDTHVYIPWTDKTAFTPEELSLLLSGFMHTPQ